MTPRPTLAPAPITTPATTPATALVTGASSGIGAATALRLARRGWRVFASVRNPDDAARLAATAGVVPVVLDVTDAASVARAFDEVGAHVDPARPFHVVNNAGIVVPGPLEDVAIDAVRRQLDVNVLGVLRVVQAALPLVRASGGRIVNVGSVSGRVALPYLGPYAASKFALRALTDALRVELAPWRIPVVLIEPGSVATPIWAKAEAEAMAFGAEGADGTAGALDVVDGGSVQPAAVSADVSHDADAGARAVRRRSAHAAWVPAVTLAYARHAADAMPADVVAAAIERALTAPRPRSHVVLGSGAQALMWLDRLLPTRWRDRLIRRALGLTEDE